MNTSLLYAKEYAVTRNGTRGIHVFTDRSGITAGNWASRSVSVTPSPPDDYEEGA